MMVNVYGIQECVVYHQAGLDGIRGGASEPLAKISQGSSAMKRKKDKTAGNSWGKKTPLTQSDGIEQKDREEL